MILEDKDNSASEIYEGMRGYFTEELTQLELLIAVYSENGDLTEEDLSEFLGPVILKKEIIKDTLVKLNKSETRDWFISMTEERLKSSVTEEDMQKLREAVVIQNKIDSIFGDSVGDLAEYLSLSLDDNKMTIN